MKQFKLNPLATVISSLVLVMAGTHYTYAQDAVIEEEEPQVNTDEEVIVTGFRRSLLNSIDTKRNADTIIESISADDIGGLPDRSIADSLARLPGITVDRTGGQAGEIQVRGLSGDFVFATLNGREQVSPNRERVIEFNQYPAELLSKVDVYKVPKASIIEGGIGATVELKTANPLELDVDHKFHVSARGSYNDRAGDLAGGDEFGSRFTISYQGKFLEDTLGFAIGYARLDQGQTAEEYIGLQFPNPSSSDFVDVDGDGRGNSIPDGFELQHTGGTEIRDGYMAAIQFEPNEKLTIQADLFLSQFESTGFSKGFRIQNLARFEIDNPILDSNGIDVIGGEFSLISETVGGVERSTRNNGPRYNSDALVLSADQGFQLISDNVTNDDEVISGGIALKWAEESWEVSADISTSRAEGFFNDGITRSHLYDVNSTTDADGNPITTTTRTDNIGLAFRLNGNQIPQITFNERANFTNLDPSRGPVVRLSTYEAYPHLNEDEVDAIRIDGKYNFDSSFIASVEAGVRYSERNYIRGRQTFVYSPFQSGDGVNANSTSLPIDPQFAEVINWQGDFSHFPSFLDIDADAVFAQAVAEGLVVDDEGNLRDTTPRARWGEGRAWSVTQSADVTEKVTAYYFLANIDTNIADMPLTGNVGVRVVDTDQSALGIFGADPANGLPADNILDGLGRTADQEGAPGFENGAAYVRNGDEYTKVLPSLSLNLSLTDNDIVRLGVAKVISRVPISDLANDTAPNYSLDRNNTVFRLDIDASNNPFLRPFEAEQIDLSYEHYFEETEGVFALALFNKDIKNDQQTVGFTEFPFQELGFGSFAIPSSRLQEPTRDPVTGEITDLGAALPVVDGTLTISTNNADAGFIRGVEVSLTQTLNFLPQPLDTFGFQASYARLDTELNVTNPFTGDTAATLPFPGLAENSGQLTLFWSYEGLELRLSTNYQDAKVGELFDPTGGDGDLALFEEQTTMDFQSSYDFGNGLQLLFQVSNLTDEPNLSSFGGGNRTGNIQFFGRQFYFGANYNFE